LISIKQTKVVLNSLKMNNTGRKFGGRSKGTPNIMTNEIREKINLLLDKQMKQFELDLMQLEPFQRVQTMLKLIELSIPKIKEVDFDINQNIEPFDIKQIFSVGNKKINKN
jgi:hypothetical protein